MGPVSPLHLHEYPPRRSPGYGGAGEQRPRLPFAQGDADDPFPHNYTSACYRGNRSRSCYRRSVAASWYAADSGAASVGIGDIGGWQDIVEATPVISSGAISALRG